MILYVFKRKRKKKGKTIPDRNYSGRYRLDGDFVTTTVSLNTGDKQVAEKKLRDIVQEKERERAGLIAPKLERVSAETPLLDHLKDFVADLRTKGREEKYIDDLESRFKRVATMCNWKYAKDIQADQFMQWRTQYEAAPKTLNEYLNAYNATLNWMIRLGRIKHNPLRVVEKIDLKGKQQERRAYTDQELNRLLQFSEDYHLLYLSAAYTGLRLKELTRLLWVNAHINEDRPYLKVPAKLTKNGKAATIPLHKCLVNEFRQAAIDVAIDDFIFPQYTHPDRRLNRHLKKAGIPKFDATGRKVDFHSFRYTFATKLARQGVSQRLAQELMRHSDPRLTANLYTDAAHLPTFDAVEKLAWHNGNTPSALP